MSKLREARLQVQAQIAAVRRWIRLYGPTDVGLFAIRALDELEGLARFLVRLEDKGADSPVPITAGPSADATLALLQDADPAAPASPDGNPGLIRIGPGGDFARRLDIDQLGRLTDVTA